ncbi:MAG: hypothetical protein WC781_01995 [Candidatus Pacearchaeota archaeon]|jgi:uncharacterized integral membrane protein
MKTKNQTLDLLDIIQIIVTIILIIFAIVILYQIIKKILGGSWTTENIIVTLLVALIGLVFTNSIHLAKLSSDYKHLNIQFRNLAKDFKYHLQTN